MACDEYQATKKIIKKLPAQYEDADIDVWNIKTKVKVAPTENKLRDL